ncbi:MAG TPA: ferric reductase-like transmembrane domain-containing protein [Acidimicrobiales bacterium]|jgi:predicted ferric reductase
MLATTLLQSKVLWYVMRASGLVALVLLTLTMVAGIVNVRRFATPRWPRAVIALLHRNVSLLAVVFLGVHVVTAILDTYVSVGWLAAIVPLTSHWDRFWVGLGTLSVDVMFALIITSLLRSRLSHRTWRAVHWLAYASWPLAMAHGLGAGTDTGAVWAEAVYALSALAVVGAVGWRLRQPTGRTLPTARRPTLATGARS